MSDTMGNADSLANALQGSTEPTQTSPEQTTQTQPEHSYSPYAQQFLQGVPEDQRAIVGEHLKKWDAGFTRYAQGVQEQLRQYSQLGDPQTIQQAVQYYQQLLNDPHSVVELLVQNGFGPRQAQQMVQNAQQGQDPFADMPEPIKQRFQAVDQLNGKFDQFQRALGLIAERLNSQDEATQAAQADRQLDALLGQLKTQYGNFDETYVLTQIAAGMGPDQAVQNYQRAIQSALNERQAKPAPNVISGGSLPAIKTPLDTAEKRTDALAAALKGLGLGN